MGKKDQPPPGPPPSYQDSPEIIRGGGGRSGFSMNPFRRPQSDASQGQPQYEGTFTYEPPPGPPPKKWYERKQASSEKDAYAPPPGPPPGKPGSRSDYVPPPGPPPSQSKSNEPEPPPYDPWMAVPDNSLLPPPPALKEHFSPTANASEEDDQLAIAWLRQNPLWEPRPLDTKTQTRKNTGDIVFSTPPISQPNLSLSWHRTGRTRVKTTSRCQDTILLSNVPLYSAQTDSPNDTEQPKTIYYELHILTMGNPRSPGDASIALGFLAAPYPAWRQPGWHRASLGVHGDDGHRYVDNAYGGQSFTQTFRPGQTVGIGMTYKPALQYGASPRCEVFFTRNGKREGSWDLWEQRDRDDEGSVEGLDGSRDLLAAVGCFGMCEFEVRMRREDCMFKPE